MAAPRKMPAEDTALVGSANVPTDMRPHYFWAKYLSTWLGATVVGLGFYMLSAMGWMDFLTEQEQDRQQVEFIPDALENSFVVSLSNVTVRFPKPLILNLTEIQSIRAQVRMNDAVGNTNSHYFDVQVDPLVQDPEMGIIVPIAELPGGVADKTKQYLFRFEFRGPRDSDGTVISGYISTRNWWRPE